MIFTEKDLIVTAVLIAGALFILSIIYPIGGEQLSRSYTCGVNNITPDPTNCSWGTTYNPDALMTQSEILIWSNIGVFGVLIIIFLFFVTIFLILDVSGLFDPKK
jgi:hypothetical protein